MTSGYTVHKQRFWCFCFLKSRIPGLSSDHLLYTSYNTVSITVIHAEKASNYTQYSLYCPLRLPSFKKCSGHLKFCPCIAPSDRNIYWYLFDNFAIELAVSALYNISSTAVVAIRIVSRSRIIQRREVEMMAGFSTQHRFPSLRR